MDFLLGFGIIAAVLGLVGLYLFMDVKSVKKKTKKNIKKGHDQGQIMHDLREQQSSRQDVKTEGDKNENNER